MAIIQAARHPFIVTYERDVFFNRKDPGMYDPALACLVQPDREVGSARRKKGMLRKAIWPIRCTLFPVL
jgi:hypothetical protein